MYTSGMDDRFQQIRDLHNLGYSKEAIACRLGLSMSAILLYFNRFGVKNTRPDGDYYTVAEESDRVSISERMIRAAIKAGELRHVFLDNRYYLKREWTDIWLNNSHYRLQAKGLQEKLFGKGGTTAT